MLSLIMRNVWVILISLQESIASKFLQELVNWTKSIKISNPLEEGCRLGPVVSEGQVGFSFET